MGKTELSGGHMPGKGENTRGRIENFEKPRKRGKKAPKKVEEQGASRAKATDENLEMAISEAEVKNRRPIEDNIFEQALVKYYTPEEAHRLYLAGVKLFREATGEDKNYDMAVEAAAMELVADVEDGKEADLSEKGLAGAVFNEILERNVERQVFQRFYDEGTPVLDYMSARAGMTREETVEETIAKRLLVYPEDRAGELKIDPERITRYAEAMFATILGRSIYPEDRASLETADLIYEENYKDDPRELVERKDEIIARMPILDEEAEAGYQELLKRHFELNTAETAFEQECIAKQQIEEETSRRREEEEKRRIKAEQEQQEEEKQRQEEGAQSLLERARREDKEKKKQYLKEYFRDERAFFDEKKAEILEPIGQIFGAGEGMIKGVSQGPFKGTYSDERIKMLMRYAKRRDSEDVLKVYYYDDGLRCRLAETNFPYAEPFQLNELELMVQEETVYGVRRTRMQILSLIERPILPIYRFDSETGEVLEGRASILDYLGAEDWRKLLIDFEMEPRDREVLEKSFDGFAQALEVEGAKSEVARAYYKVFEYGRNLPTFLAQMAQRGEELGQEFRDKLVDFLAKNVDYERYITRFRAGNEEIFMPEPEARVSEMPPDEFLGTLGTFTSKSGYGVRKMQTLAKWTQIIGVNLPGADVKFGSNCFTEKRVMEIVAVAKFKLAGRECRILESLEETDGTYFTLGKAVYQINHFNQENFRDSLDVSYGKILMYLMTGDEEIVRKYASRVKMPENRGLDLIF